LTRPRKRREREEKKAEKKKKVRKGEMNDRVPRSPTRRRFLINAVDRSMNTLSRQRKEEGKGGKTL